jgi:hypothetical protein
MQVGDGEGCENRVLREKANPPPSPLPSPHHPRGSGVR